MEKRKLAIVLVSGILAAALGILTAASYIHYDRSGAAGWSRGA